MFGFCFLSPYPTRTLSLSPLVVCYHVDTRHLPCAPIASRVHPPPSRLCSHAVVIASFIITVLAFVAQLRDKKWFQTSIIVVIFVAGFLVGVQTYDIQDDDVIFVTEYVPARCRCMHPPLATTAHSHTRHTIHHHHHHNCSPACWIPSC